MYDGVFEPSRELLPRSKHRISCARPCRFRLEAEKRRTRLEIRNSNYTKQRNATPPISKPDYNKACSCLNNFTADATVGAFAEQQSLLSVATVRGFWFSLPLRSRPGTGII